MRRAHLLEYAGDEELAQMVWRGDDLAAAEIIAGVLNKLHRAQPDVTVPQLRTLRQRFRRFSGRRREMKRRAKNPSTCVGRGRRSICWRIHRMNACCTVIFSTITSGCIRCAAGWRMMPKGLYGERLYDAANTLCNPCHCARPGGVRGAPAAGVAGAGGRYGRGRGAAAGVCVCVCVPECRLVRLTMIAMMAMSKTSILSGPVSLS